MPETRPRPKPQSTNPLTRKLGPAPVWVWAVAAIVAYYGYKKFSTSSATSTAASPVSAGTSSTPTQVDAAGNPINTGAAGSGLGSPIDNLSPLLDSLVGSENALATAFASYQPSSYYQANTTTTSTYNTTYPAGASSTGGGGGGGGSSSGGGVSSTGGGPAMAIQTNPYANVPAATVAASGGAQAFAAGGGLGPIGQAMAAMSHPYVAQPRAGGKAQLGF